jgi:hypothetical protein
MQIPFLRGRMKNIFLLLIIITGFAAVAFSQTISRKVIPAAGGILTGGGNTITFTIGEPVTASLTAGSNMITQGFQQPDRASLTTDYFRSITSGNWNDPATWESSPVADFSAGLVKPASLTPTDASNIITIAPAHTVTVTANVQTDQTFVSSGGALVVNGSTLTVINNGLTIQSNIAGTGRIGTSTGVFAGNVMVERYIANAGHRAWHLLSGKAINGSQTIFQSWQENGTPGVSLPGYGTWITSNVYAVSNGFDAASNSASILTHNQGGAGGPSWNYNLANTNATALSANQGYMVFVRGDRNYTATLPTPTATNATTLRTAGPLTQGTQAAVNVSAVGTGRTLVGNPYASPIDFESIQATANLNQTFYVWDATLTGNYGAGGFVLVDRNGGTYQTTPVVLGGTTNDPNSRYIHSGQAFFLKATGADANVVFTENSKAALISAVNPIVNAPGEQQLLVNLMIANAGGERSLADGIRIKFADGYLPATADDDEKIGNFAENLSSYRNNKKLIVERRPFIVKSDTIFLNMANTGVKKYSLQLRAVDFVQTGLPARLIDTYLGTGMDINLNGNIDNYDFTINADAGSAAANRFMIVFGKPAVSPPLITKAGINVYPNPVTGNSIGIQFNDMVAGVYKINLISNSGQLILTSNMQHNGATAFYNININRQISAGNYRLEIIKPDKSKVLKNVFINRN